MINSNMKVKDGIMGLIVGDALGVPVEFYPRDELEKNPITKMKGNGTYNQPKGTWSDDSSMTIATMTSIINKKSVDLEDLMKEFIEWLYNDKYTPHGDVFDCGITTRDAIDEYMGGTPINECGRKDEHDNGNGSLMRILPLAFVKNIDKNTVENVSALTHAHNRSKIICVYYVEIAKSMINHNLTIEEHIENANEKIIKYYEDSDELIHLKRIFENDFSDGLLATGYVVNTIEVAIYCLKTTKSYKEAVLKAVNLGGDSDTNAAVCGGLAGIYYGYDSIPQEWIKELAHNDELITLCEKYEEICNEY